MGENQQGSDAFREGDPVRVNSGPNEGVEGVFLRRDGTEAVIREKSGKESSLPVKNLVRVGGSLAPGSRTDGGPSAQIEKWEGEGGAPAGGVPAQKAKTAGQGAK